jgi:hypothetical protein
MFFYCLSHETSPLNCRNHVGCGAVAEQMEAQSLDMERLVNILCQEKYNKQGANLRKHNSSSRSGLFSSHDGTGKSAYWLVGTLTKSSKCLKSANRKFASSWAHSTIASCNYANFLDEPVRKSKICKLLQNTAQLSLRTVQKKSI